jgi:LysM repeat protein
MKRFLFSLLFLFCAVFFSSAQKVELLIKKSDKGLYLEHKVKPKESFYALGRMYNIDPKLIASFNSLDYNKGLQIDQKLRIPLTDANFIQDGNKGTPVYYKVGNKESLDKISLNNNNVLKSNLRWWNNLSSEEVKSDTKLIVGFIQSPSMASITIAGKPISEQSVFHTEEQKNQDEGIREVKKPEVKPEEKKPEPAVLKEEVKKPEPAVVKEEVKPVVADQGYFKNHFIQQTRSNPADKNETVTSGIFKTTSGWQDAKYYLLMDKVSPGTIVKVINPVNNKAVYAKVLGEMSGIRQNAGLDVRISNAAAAALEITELDKFIVKVNY